MTREELKRRLHLYHSIDLERRQILDEMGLLRDRMTSPSSPNLDGMPMSPGVGDPVSSAVIRYEALEDRYLRKVRQLEAEQHYLEDLIEDLDPIYRTLMRLRYIDSLTWEEVCVAINYSWRQTHNLHARALEQILQKQN